MATVSVRVGCSWSNNHKAWNKSRIALKAVAKEVQMRLQPGKRHMLKAVPKQLDRIVEYRRLRATPGETISTPLRLLWRVQVAYWQENLSISENSRCDPHLPVLVDT